MISMHKSCYKNIQVLIFIFQTGTNLCACSTDEGTEDYLLLVGGGGVTMLHPPLRAYTRGILHLLSKSSLQWEDNYLANTEL